MKENEFANILAWAKQSDSTLVSSIYQTYNQSDFEAFHPLLLSRNIAVELVGAVKLAHSDDPYFADGPDTSQIKTIIAASTTLQIISARARRLSARWTVEYSEPAHGIDGEIIDSLVEDIGWDMWLKETNWNGDED